MHMWRVIIYLKNYLINLYKKASDGYMRLKNKYIRTSIRSTEAYSLHYNPFFAFHYKPTSMTETNLVINIDEDSTSTTSTAVPDNETRTNSEPRSDEKTYSPPFSPSPIFYPLFTAESHRYNHFTNSPVRFSRPNALRIFSLNDYARIPPCHFYLQTPKSMAVIVTTHDVMKYFQKIVETEYNTRAYILLCDVDMFTAYMKSEAYYKLRHFCAKKHILLGAYVVQRSDNLYIPAPTFNQKRIFAFDFHILDSSCQDKYSSILDIITYFTQIGIPSHRIVVPFFPDAQINLKSRNLMGYFFRDDLCSSYIRRIQANADDLGFP